MPAGELDLKRNLFAIETSLQMDTNVQLKAVMSRIFDTELQSAETLLDYLSFVHNICHNEKQRLVRSEKRRPTPHRFASFMSIENFAVIENYFSEMN